jgi:alanine racemase
MYYHRVWADINLDAVSFNLNQVKSILPRGVAIMLVVKADAYGHGAVSIARHLENQGLWGFGVGDSTEALELRAAGITLPILILGAIIEGEIERVVNNDISVCIHSAARVKLMDREARRQGRPCRVHLMVDTGMGRLGIFPERALDLARKIDAAPGLVLEGVATHYASTSVSADPFLKLQMDRFLRVKTELEGAGIRPQFFHASNSGAIFSPYPEPFNLVRPGLAVYGIHGSPEPPKGPPLRPALSLKTQIIYMKDVPAGTPIGYGCLYTTPESTRIATLPIGYNDGYGYRLSGRGRVLVHGRVAPVVGAVSMDYTMIDVGRIKDTAVGDLVTLIGEDGAERIRVEALADMAGTIPYEITCGIGRRVQRIAQGGSKEGLRSPSKQEGKSRPLQAGAAEHVNPVRTMD